MTQEISNKNHVLQCVSIKLTNNNGTKLTVTNYGASIVGFEILNKKGELVNVIVGLDIVEDYQEAAYHSSAKFLGASIGRYAGRISKGSFELNNQKYKLYQNSGVHLHGGKEGFDKKLWKIDSINRDQNMVVFSYDSKHMEEGYPGNLQVKATYQLSEDDELKITYTAVSDQDTAINLTNHGYFNLNGYGSILDHLLSLDCPDYLEVDEKQLPTGNIRSVTNSRFDFLELKKLKSLENDGLIDDTFIYSNKQPAIEDVKIRLITPLSGLQMEIKTNQPAVVIYTPENFPKWKFKNQVNYTRFPAICFENQNYPDAPNHNHFPSSLLKAGEEYKNTSIFRFSAI
ncbi:aldose epimerase family protein [Aquimarina sp. SS2-1]|uniref:aldose epimerase family protein n=1 Tax=Aquimarina besae TaxID=3342247 RepID=UPI0036701C8F